MNTHNRNVRRRQIDQLRAVILKGEWIINGETVKFDWDGRLMDGQHRLEAIVRADHAEYCFVVRNLDPKAQETIDVGMGRTAGDVITLRGLKYGQNLGTAGRFLWNLLSYGTFADGRLRPTHTEVADLVTSIEGVEDYARQAMLLYGKTGLRPGVGTALMVLLREASQNLPPQLWQDDVLGDEPVDKAEEFFRRLERGTGFISDHDPVLRLRETLQRLRNLPKGSERPRSWVLAALTIKAWNAFVEGTEVQQLRYRRGGPQAESFPSIRGLEDSLWYRNPLDSSGYIDDSVPDEE